MLVVLVLLLCVLGAWLCWPPPGLPPGPLGLPLLGSLWALDPARPHHSLAGLARRYGGACCVRLGAVRTIILTDARLIRDAFSRDAFAGRAPLYLTHGIMQGQGIICAEGELWKDQRRLLVTWMRAIGAAKVSAKRQALEARIAKVVDHLMERLSSRSSPLAPVPLQQFLADSLGSCVNQLVYGATFPDEDRTWLWLLHIQEEAVRHMGVAAIVNFMPYLRFFMPSIRKTTQVIIEAQSQSHSIMRSLVETRRKLRALRQTQKPGSKMPSAGELYPEGETAIRCVHHGIEHGKEDVHYFRPSSLLLSGEECVLDHYLEEQEQRRQADADSEMARRLSDQQMIFLLADLFGAGLDTTLVTLSWFLLFMAVNPEEQELVRAELLQECGSRCPSLEDQPQLRYTRAAICEAQRLRPVVPVGIPHGALHDVQLGPWRVPKGTMVMPLQWALHTDDRVWDEPMLYKPKRFLDEQGELISPQNFMPFQTGKRMCPGDELARMMLFLYGARIVSRYRLRLHGTLDSLEGVMGLTLAPPHHQLILEPIANN